MERLQVEFRVPLPAADAMELCEGVLGAAGWRVTGKEPHALFGAWGGSISWPIGLELVLTPTGDAETEIRCTAWTRVGGFSRRRYVRGQLERLQRLVAAQTPVDPATPRVERLPPLEGRRSWAFWRR